MFSAVVQAPKFLSRPQRGFSTEVGAKRDEYSPESKLITFDKVEEQTIPRLNKEEINKYVESIKEKEFLTGIPSHQLGRKVTITQAKRVSMQSGLKSGYSWELKFAPLQKWKNPLMGWTSGSDPYARHIPTFENLESALNFCVQSGFDFDITEPTAVYIDSRGYSDNFDVVKYKKSNQLPDPFL